MVMDILIFLMVGLTAGVLAGLITHERGQGLVWVVILGVVGALLGGLSLDLLELRARGDFVGPLLASVAGSLIVLLITVFARRG